MIKEKEHKSNHLFHITESKNALNIIQNGFIMKPLRCHDSRGGYSAAFGSENIDEIYAAYFFDNIKTLSNSFTGPSYNSSYNKKSHSVIFTSVKEMKKLGLFLFDDFYQQDKPITNYTMAVSNKLKIIPGSIFRFLCSDSSVGKAPI